MGRLDARKINGFPNYLISPEGEVISLERMVRAKGGGTRLVLSRILRPNKDKDGYLFVTLFNDGYRTCKRVSRLVAEAFIPNPLNLPEVNHKHPDGDKTRNTVENLEWSTSSDNRLHALYVLKVKRGKSMLGKLGKDCPNSKRIHQIKDGTVIKTWDSQADAERGGFRQQGVSRCCLGERKSYKGFQWRLA